MLANHVFHPILLLLLRCRLLIHHHYHCFDPYWDFHLLQLLLCDCSAVVVQLEPLPPLLAVVLAHGDDVDVVAVVGGVVVAS